MSTRGSIRRRLSTLVLASVMVGGVLGTVACRTTEADVQRWEHTEAGPRKLVAVLTHDRYPLPLRVEAAVSLARLGPRKGRHIGIVGSDDEKEGIGLIRALASLKPAVRAKIVAALAQRLEAEMLAKPKPRKKKKKKVTDPTVPFKDAVFALLTQESGALVSDAAVQEKLRQALIQWCSTEFVKRVEDTTQLYGVETVLKHLKADGVRPLTALLDEAGVKGGYREARFDLVARLVSQLGDDATKLDASTRLVAVARYVDSPKWREDMKPEAEKMNKASGEAPSPEQLEAQLGDWQSEELMRVLQGLKQVGGAPAAAFLIDYAKDGKQAEKRRFASLMALQGNLDKKNDAQIKAILDIATAEDTPDSVREAAMRRASELPREKVVDALYTLFAKPRLREVAASYVLQMSDTSHVPEFMKRLEKLKDLGLSEPFRYGGLIGAMKGSTAPIAAITPFLDVKTPQPNRLVALGVYYAVGTKTQTSAVDAFGAETGKIDSKCTEEGNASCDWKCVVDKTVKDEKGKPKVEGEAKAVATIGDFVQFCVKPAMEKRAEAPKAAPK